MQIIFEGSSINKILDGEIEFVIHFGQYYPYKSPKVFCKTQVYYHLLKISLVLPT